MTQACIHQTHSRPVFANRQFLKAQDYFKSGLRDNIEEIAKLTLGQEIGGTLVASADIGLVMLRRAAILFLQNRREQAVH